MTLLHPSPVQQQQQQSTTQTRRRPSPLHPPSSAASSVPSPHRPRSSPYGRANKQPKHQGHGSTFVTGLAVGLLVNILLLVYHRFIGGTSPGLEEILAWLPHGRDIDDSRIRISNRTRQEFLTQKYQTFVQQLPPEYQHVFLVETKEDFPTLAQDALDCPQWFDMEPSLPTITLTSSGNETQLWYLQQVEHHLLCEWQRFAMSSQSQLQIPYVLGPKPQPMQTPLDRLANISIRNDIILDHNLDDEDITLVTQSSLDRLDRLVIHARQWHGPMSVALYITNMPQLRQAITFFRKQLSLLEQTTVHMVWERPMDVHDDLYPHNTLRNCALNYTETKHVLLLDMDFMMNYGTSGQGPYADLKELIQTKPTLRQALHDQTLLVLPAFERAREWADYEDWLKNHPNGHDLTHLKDAKYDDDDDTERPRPHPFAWMPRAITNRSKDWVPSHKGELRKYVKKYKLAEPFHIRRFQDGHWATNYRKWWDNATGAMYHIAYETGYEPYVLACRNNGNPNASQMLLPWFWSGYRGYGRNKQSWYVEMDELESHDFAVLRDWFVFHLESDSAKHSLTQAMDLLQAQRTQNDLYFQRKRNYYNWTSGFVDEEEVVETPAQKEEEESVEQDDDDDEEEEESDEDSEGDDDDDDDDDESEESSSDEDEEESKDKTAENEAGNETNNATANEVASAVE